MKEIKPDITDNFSDPQWVAKLAYLADVFNKLNELNLSIQGGYVSILEVSDKIAGFMKKTARWIRRIQEGVTEMFPQLTEFLHENNLRVDIVREVNKSNAFLK